MKIKSITIQGFRGFNDERTIDLHGRLTLIYAPNSYGKTSISEALEWLLFGTTSKLANADYKGEYKGSFRNPHLPDKLNPVVKAVLADAEREYEMQGELQGAEGIKMILDGSEVRSWDHLGPLTSVGKPFILQHSLKELLHVEPAQRFLRFASILGLQHIDEVQRDIVSLCTKYESAIPPEVKALMDRIHRLRDRVQALPELSAIGKCFKAKKPCADIKKAVETACKCKLPEGTSCDSYLAELVRLRDETVSKLFSGSLKLAGFTELEVQSNHRDEEYCLSHISEEFIRDYLALAKIAIVGHILDRARFMGLGVEAIAKEPSVCPFCKQTLDADRLASIRCDQESVSREAEASKALGELKSKMEQSLDALGKRLGAYYNRHTQASAAILATESSFEKLERLLSPRHKDTFTSVQTAISELRIQKLKLDTSAKETSATITAIKQTLAQAQPDVDVAQKLGSDIVDFIVCARKFAEVVARHTAPIASADRVLQQQLDSLAGTTDLSTLIELLDGWADIEKVVQIDGILDSLKDLRKTTDQFAAARMLEAVSGEFSQDVLDWYKQIRTAGDPDVHFQGFDMERNANGELKARRVQIKASSYGKDLISAVSSLSESKLNALGLCLSIATNLKSNTPFGFLLIDDPIQSWDADHETRFIEVIRKLIEGGKQVILLSHNKSWIKQVRLQCRSLNGWYYEITGYSQEGPNIIQCSWDEWSNRLSNVDAILKDSTADERRLQQAEEEIRIVVGDITAQLYKKVRGISKNANKLNSRDVNKMLTECGVDSKLVDRVVGTFSTTDDSHHDPADYTPNRERIRCYHGWAHDLANYLKN